MWNFEHIDKNNAAELLEKMIRGVEKAFRIHITIHDHKGLLSLPDGGNILPGRNIHRSGCCSWRLKDRRPCVKHCKEETWRKGSTRQTPWRSVCWRGLAEVVAPVYRGESYMATLFAGSFQLPGMMPEPFPKEYRALYRALPVWDDDYAREIALMLQVTGEGLMQVAERIYEESMNEFGRAGLIRRFLNRHADRDIGIGDLAEHLGLSESRTGHLVKEYFGRTFAALLNEERVRRAMALLGENTLSMAEVAERVGFDNEYYFNRVFRKVAGMPPGAFRKTRVNRGATGGTAGFCATGGDGRPGN